MKIQISLSKYLDDTGAGRALLKYAGKGYYVHFSKTTKLGVNPNAFHRDFSGTYFYSLDWLVKNANYSQYALTFPYYSVVHIRKTASGFKVEDFSVKQLTHLVSAAGLEKEYLSWRNGDRTSISPAKSLLEFYAHCRTHKIKGNLLKGVDWIEDCGSGFFNPKEPEQIVVRNLNIVKVVDSGATKSTSTDLLSTYRAKLVDTLGKPNLVSSKRHDGLTIGLTLQYQVYSGFKPLIFTFYPVYGGGVHEGWRLESSYQYVDEVRGALVIRYHTTGILITPEDDASSIPRFATISKSEYIAAKNLAELKMSDSGLKYLDQDLLNINPLHDVASEFMAHRGVLSEFLTTRVTNVFTQRQNSISDSDILDEVPFLNPNGFEMFKYDYGEAGQFNLSRRDIRQYRSIKSKLPQSRWNTFLSVTKQQLSKYFDEAQIQDLISKLEG